jgi:hypothetical protein
VILKTISPNNLLGSYVYKYLDKAGELKKGKILVSVPLREPGCISCRIMIEDQFERPTSLFAGSSLQAVHFAYWQLSRYLKGFVDNGELMPVPVKNFDECSSKKKIDLFDVLATQPDYDSLCYRRNRDSGSINFATIALEESLNFKAHASRCTVPVTMTLAVPVQRKKLWYCSYYISELMDNPMSTGSSHSLNAVTLALREMYILMKAKTDEGKFFVRKFDDSRSLEELDLKLCFKSALRI